MSEVFQAHLPGNYELYDSSTDRTGPGICKGCWEEAKQEVTSPLQTVWVSVGGAKMVWWLCANHADDLGKGNAPIQIMKRSDGVMPSPKI